MNLSKFSTRRTAKCSTMAAQTPLTAIRRKLSLKRSATLAGVILLAVVSMWTWGALSHNSVAGAQDTAPAVDQCDAGSASAFPTGAGYEVTCTIAIVNTITAQGATSSTVTAIACLADAGVTYPSCPDNLALVPSLPVSTVTNSSQLVTSVNQCNSIVTGGGSNVICNVTVTNNVPAATSTTNVTVNQCIGSGTGGGSTVSCAPSGSTTGASVTQCNGSATGGGTYAGEAAVNCTVTGATAALPVTINQCNGSATGGGSAVTCSATVTNSFATTPTTTTPTTPTTTTTTPTTTTTTPTTTTTTPTTTTTSTVPVTTTTHHASTTTTTHHASTTTTTHHASTTTSTVVPVGAPATGQGGASGSGTPKGLISFSALAVALAAGSVALRSRRQRGRPSTGGPTRDW